MQDQAAADEVVESHRVSARPVKSAQQQVVHLGKKLAIRAKWIFAKM